MKILLIKKTQEKEKIKFFLSILREDYPVLAVSAILGIIVSGLAMAVFSQKLIDEILSKKTSKTDCWYHT